MRQVSGDGIRTAGLRQRAGLPDWAPQPPANAPRRARPRARAGAPRFKLMQHLALTVAPVIHALSSPPAARYRLSPTTEPSPMRPNLRLVHYILIHAAAVDAFACGGGDLVLPGGSGAPAISAVRGDSQRGTVGLPLAD